MTLRPLPDEALGSWLGRAAARYRIGFDELIAASGLEVDIGEQACTWLAAVPKGEGSVRRLCHIENATLGMLSRARNMRRLVKGFERKRRSRVTKNSWRKGNFAVASRVR